MAVDYNDERFNKVENEKNNSLNNVTNQYDQMIQQSDKFYQDQANAVKDYQKQQAELQQQQTDLVIQKQEQAKEQANKAYQKEQKGAYTDYQKATDQFGVNAEKLAQNGLTNTGYAESTRTNAYNTYQNRYMMARETYNTAILNYDNAIKEAQLANSSAMAQLAYETLQKQLELALQGFQYKNSLLESKMNALNAENDRYYQRWRDVLEQLNVENNFEEQQRQFNEQMNFNKQQAEQDQANWQREFDFNQQQAQQDQANWEREFNFSQQQAEQEQANWEKEYALSQASKTVSLSSGSGGSSRSSSGGETSVVLSVPNTPNYGTGYETALNKAKNLANVKNILTGKTIDIQNNLPGQSILKKYLASEVSAGRLTQEGVKKILSTIGLA